MPKTEKKYMRDRDGNIINNPFTGTPMEDITPETYAENGDYSKFGLPNLDYYNDKSKQMQDQGFVRSNQAYQEQKAYGQNQNEFAKALLARAQGQGPSVNAMQLQAAQGQAMQGAQGQSAAGNNSNLARLLATNQLVNRDSQANQALGAARSQEQAQATQAYQGFTQAQRAQATQNQDSHNKIVQYYLNAGMDLDKAQQQANIFEQNLIFQDIQEANTMNSKNAIDKKAEALAKQQMLMGIVQNLGNTLMSDKRAKENISKVSDGDVKNFLDKLTAYNYEYKKGLGLSEGKQFGVMAQDMEKSKLGKTMVDEGTLTDSKGHKLQRKVIEPDTDILHKTIDYLEQRIAAIESKRGK